MTGDKRVNFATKRLLTRDALDDQFFTYLQDQLLDVASRVWGSQRGVFGSATLVSGGNDELTITTLPIDLIDGDGRILTLAGTDAQDIRFQNTNAITYSVGAKFVEIPSGVSRNPRNDVINYDSFEDGVGVDGDPDDVTENVGTLRLTVDSIFESGVSNAGRLVTVYLKTPVTDVEADAIERNLVVAWTGSENVVDTSGLLGQQTGSASEVPSDYTVIAQGITVRRNTDLSTTDPYAFLGTVTGGGAGSPPSGFSTAGQIDVTDGINPDLQEAYTAGRTIAPSVTYGGSVRIATADSGDNIRAALQIDRQGSTEDNPVGQVTIADEADGANILHLHPLSMSSSLLNVGEAAELDAVDGTLNLTRGGALDLTNSNLDPHTDVVILSGFPNPVTNNKIYLLASVVDPVTCTVTELDGSTPSNWNASDSGLATFYRIRTKVGHPNWTAEQRGHVLLSGENEAITGSTVLEIVPSQSEDSIVAWDDDATPTKRFRVTDKGVLVLEKFGAGAIEDGQNTQLRLTRFEDTTSNVQFMLTMFGNDSKAVPIAYFCRVARNGFGQDIAAVLSGSGTITFSGGLDPSSANISDRLHFVFVETAGAQYGLYRVKASSVTSTSLDVEAINGSLPTWTGTRTVSVLEPRFAVAGSTPTSGTNLDLVRGLLYNSQAGGATVRPISIICPDDSLTGDLLRAYAPGKLIDNGAAVMLRVQNDGQINIGDQWEAGSVQNQAPGGLHVYGRPRDTTDADKFGLHLRPSLYDPDGDTNLPVASGRVGALYDGWENEINRWTQWGRWAEAPRLFDHFTGYLDGAGSKDANGNLMGRWQLDDDSAAGKAEIIGGGFFSKRSGGIFQLKTDGAANSTVSIETSSSWTAKEGASDIKRAISMAGRLRLVGDTDADALQEVIAKFVWTRNASAIAGWRYIATGSNANWQSYTTGGATTLSANRTAATRGTNNSMDDGWMDFYVRIDFDAGYMWCWMTGMTAIATGALAEPTNTNWTGGGKLIVSLETTDTTEKELQIDWLDIWTDDLQDGISG